MNVSLGCGDVAYQVGCVCVQRRTTIWNNFDDLLVVDVGSRQTVVGVGFMCSVTMIDGQGEVEELRSMHSLSPLMSPPDGRW